MKLFRAEPESAELRRYLGTGAHVASSAVVRVEVLRALRRASVADAELDGAIGFFEGMYLRRSSDELLDRASRLPPPSLRTLDALHLATALDFSPPPDFFLCYDQRLSEAARSHGLNVVAPGVDEVHES